MARISVDEGFCKGCGLCVSACPKHLLYIDKDMLNEKGHSPAAMSDESQCIACAFCATMCPDCVIKVEK